MGQADDRDNCHTGFGTFVSEKTSPSSSAGSAVVKDTKKGAIYKIPKANIVVNMTFRELCR